MQQHLAAGSGRMPERAGLRARTAVLALDLGAPRIRAAAVAVGISAIGPGPDAPPRQVPGSAGRARRSAVHERVDAAV